MERGQPMPVIKIENSKEISSKGFQRMLQEAWENGSPLDDLLEIVWQLAELEQKYNMKSTDFIEEFGRGEMGDEMDFIWWASIYDLYLDLREQIERALIKVAVMWEDEKPSTETSEKIAKAVAT
jgi:hypothetical protein